MTDKLNITEVRKIDISDMHGLIYNFFKELEIGAQLADAADISALNGRPFSSIILAGMGGSAIGGDLVRSYLENILPIPFKINRTYEIPAFVNDNTLAFVSSYSGNTEETLSCLEKFIEVDAQIICISTGGKVKEIANKEGILFIELPPGYPPRAALGFSFTPILVLLARLGLIPDQSDYLKEAAALLENERDKLAAEVPYEQNEAKKSAAKLHDKLPVIYTATQFFDTIGVRFRGQIEENAKMLAYSATIPEMNHNELVGWNHLFNMNDNLTGVFLDDKALHRQVKQRMALTADILEQNGVETIFLASKGEGLLARLFSLIQLADFTSLYLAILNEEDPTPVKVIEEFKKRLSRG